MDTTYIEEIERDEDSARLEELHFFIEESIGNHKVDRTFLQEMLDEAIELAIKLDDENFIYEYDGKTF